MVWQLIAALIVGCLIGPLARLILPGKQSISVPVTIVLGALGSLGGSALARQLTDSTGNAFKPIPFFLGIVVAIILVVVYGLVTGRKQVR